MVFPKPRRQTEFKCGSNIVQCLCWSNREIKQRQRRRLRKRHLKSQFALLQTLSRFFHLVEFVKCWQLFLEWNSKGQYQSPGKEKESCCLVFTSSTKREIRHFHVVVVQRRLRNAQKSVMYVHGCCFAYSMYCFFAFLVVRWRQRLRRWPRYPRKTQYLGFYTHNMVSGIAFPVY